METELSSRYDTIVADAGYESEDNYSYLEDHGQRAMIKPVNYYTCRAGKRLYAIRTRERQERGSDYTRRTTIYR